MSSSSLDSSVVPSPGLIGNTAAGYLVAARHLRQLLAVLLPVLATGLLALGVLDLVLGRDQLLIVDGVPGVPAGGGALPWARLAVLATCWLVALPAAALVAAGAERGQAVRPGRALRAALRHLPMNAVGLGLTVGAGLLVLRAAAGRSGWFGLVLVIAALVVVGLLAARMLFGVLTAQLGGTAWALTRGRVISTAGAVLLGGLGIPLFLAYVADQLRLTGVVPVVAQAVGALLVTGVVAVQAGLLAHVYLVPRVPADGAETADLAVADPLLAELSGGAPRRPWLAVAATALALVAPAGVAAANPFGSPTVRSHGRAPSGAVAVAWPAGRHPVIATISGAWFCDNDACDRFTDQNGGPPAMDGYGTAAISADGDAVVKAAVTGSQDKGGPFIHYARCTRDGCPEAYLPVRASAREAFGWPEMAPAVAPDKSIWFVLAMPSAEDAPGKATYRITFVHCPDVGCAKPERHDAGTVERLPYDEATDRRKARLLIGADGRPVATIRTGSEAVVVTCEPVTCAAPRTAWTWAGKPGTPWAAPDSPAGAVVSFEPGALRVGEQLVPLRGNATAQRSGAVAVAGSHYYATAAEDSTGQRPGVHVTIGGSTAEPDYWQQVLWRCDRTDCRRQALDGFDTFPEREVMAVATDGRVLIVRPDRVLLVSAPK